MQTKLFNGTKSKIIRQGWAAGLCWVAQKEKVFSGLPGCGFAATQRFSFFFLCRSGYHCSSPAVPLQPSSSSLYFSSPDFLLVNVPFAFTCCKHFLIVSRVFGIWVCGREVMLAIEPGPHGELSSAPDSLDNPG